MQLPLQITFRHIQQSDALESAIRDRVDKLNLFYPRIMSCRVVVQEAAAHKHQGKLFTIRIDLKTPRREIAVTRESHEDIYVAMRDVFDAAKRSLEDELRQQRGEVKLHDVALRGRVARLDVVSGFGFIETAEGNEYYFSRDNVVKPTFDTLAPGTEVQFIVDYAAEGKQAKRVSIGKHRFPSEA